MKGFAAFLFCVLLFSCIAAPSGDDRPVVNAGKTRQKAREAQAYCQAKNFNSEYCILVDMSLHSGLKRFFVWDFAKDSILHRFLVGHGCCSNPWSLDASRD